MKIITGYTGTKHITAEQDRDINIGIFGGNSYVLSTGLKMSAEISTNNEIKIRDGVLIHQGCAASITKNTYDSIPIANGSQGMKRIDLIVARYRRNEETGVESIGFEVIQGAPTESNPVVPTCTIGGIQEGDAIADMPMYAVHLDGLNITSVDKMFAVLENIEILQVLNEYSNVIEPLVHNDKSGSMIFSKRGQMVNFTFEWIGDVSNINTTIVMGTIPSEFRPAVKQVRTINLYNSNVPAGIARIVFRETGVVEMVSNTTEFKEYIFSGCWMTN